MRCQRCGFEIEAGQTFCSMCGTEQSRAQRVKKKSPKSILWLVRVVSKSHLKMWLVFITTLVVSALMYGILGLETPVVISSFCLDILLVAYELFYVLIGYKNPNSTKSKSYKIRYRAFAILLGLLVVFTVVLDFGAIATWVNNTF